MNKTAKTTAKSTAKTTETPHEVLGCFVVETKGSNPNGDPNNNGAPRVTSENTGVISNVSINRKERDMILHKTDTFLSAAKEVGFTDKEIEDRFHIYVRTTVTASEIQKEFAKDPAAFNEKHYDARVFGSTLVAEGARNPNKCGGPIALGHAVSLHPINVEALQRTRNQGMSGDKKGDFAGEATPVLYGVYVGRLHIAWNNRALMGVEQRDVDLYLKLLPHVYDMPANGRSGTDMLQVFTLRKPLNMPISGNTFVAMCQPKSDLDPESPAKGRGDYKFETVKSVKEKLKAYFTKQNYDWDGEGLEVVDMTW